jgi:hypothetical protein
VKYINQKNCRDFTLEAAKTHRPAHPFERVSGEFLEQLDREVRNIIIQKVKALPSVGQTVK